MIIINSMTDVITNSSTSVFVIYAEHNIDSIKELVNSILAIDGRYTFDDLFNVLSPSAIPTAFDIPCPNEPVDTSTPLICLESG